MSISSGSGFDQYEPLQIVPEKQRSMTQQVGETTLLADPLGSKTGLH